MSWSFYFSGKAGAVIKAIDRLDGTYPIRDEPEKMFRENALAMITAVLKSIPEDFPVKVSASGSQGNNFELFTGNPKDGVINALSISVEPIWGFIE